MKTHNVKASDIKKKWVVVDAENQVLGRLASQIATILRGKDKPTFTPHLDTGDNVIVVNATKVKLTGNKLEDKFYYKYTGYIGGLKTASAQQLLNRGQGNRMIVDAVKGMLPKNKLNKKLMTNLRVFEGPEHNMDGQKPEPMNILRTIK